jgi:hypothetical protein
MYHQPVLNTEHAVIIPPGLHLHKGIFNSNLHKFNSEIQDPKFGHDVANDTITSRRYADRSDDIIWGPVARRSTICVTSLRLNDIYKRQPCDKTV